MYVKCVRKWMQSFSTLVSKSRNPFLAACDPMFSCSSRLLYECMTFANFDDTISLRIWTQHLKDYFLENHILFKFLSINPSYIVQYNFLWGNIFLPFSDLTHCIWNSQSQFFGDFSIEFENNIHNSLKNCTLQNIEGGEVLKT